MDFLPLSWNKIKKKNRNRHHKMKKILRFNDFLYQKKSSQR